MRVEGPLDFTKRAVFVLKIKAEEYKQKQRNTLRYLHNGDERNICQTTFKIDIAAEVLMLVLTALNSLDQKFLFFH